MQLLEAHERPRAAALCRSPLGAQLARLVLDAEEVPVLGEERTRNRLRGPRLVVRKRTSPVSEWWETRVPGGA
jgi:hypothetical protein